MTDNKKPIPASIIWKNKRELLPIEYDWAHIIQVCREALTGDSQFVILPIEQSQEFKPHRHRLVKDDKASPRGLIQRDRYAREMYYPYAAARFDAEELVTYAAERFNTLSREEIENMSKGLVETLNPESE